jgi:hypothetical protein
MNNEKAFPNPHLRDDSGITMRDYFAAKAMQGMLAGLLAYGRDIVWSHIAEDAYKQADAMLKAEEA